MTHTAENDAQLDGLTVPEPPARATEQAVRDSVKAAQLDDRDAGAAQLAIQTARAVDLAIVRKDPYAVAQAGRELSAQLHRLRLDPVSRQGSDAGEVAGWLAQLGAAAGGDQQPAAGPAG